jgi:hypothetical protein
MPRRKPVVRRKPLLNASTEKIAIYAIGAGVSYFLIVRPLLIKLGIIKSAAELAAERERKDNVNDYINTTIRTGTPTKSLGEWQIIADQIYEFLRYSGASDNKDGAMMQIMRVKNEADLATLLKTFGSRQEYFFGIPYGGLQNLVSFVKSNLSNSQISTINSNLGRKNIKFKF